MAEFLRLEEFGLISGASGVLSNTFTIPAGKPVALHYKSHYLAIVAEKTVEFDVMTAFLTRVGQQIYSITKAADEIERARAFALAIPKQSLSLITYAPTDRSEPDIVLWKKEETTG